MEHLQNILSGPQARRYGPVPKVQLPDDDFLVSTFATEILGVVKHKGIYRRDMVPVIANSALRKLVVVEAPTFRTWVEQFLVCYKQRWDAKGRPYEALRTMSKEHAEGVLKCAAFLSGLLEVQTVNPERSLVIDSETGVLALHEPGYDPKTRTLTFDSEP